MASSIVVAAVPTELSRPLRNVILLIVLDLGVNVFFWIEDRYLPKNWSNHAEYETPYASSVFAPPLGVALLVGSVCMFFCMRAAIAYGDIGMVGLIQKAVWICLVITLFRLVEGLTRFCLMIGLAHKIWGICEDLSDEMADACSEQLAIYLPAVNMLSSLLMLLVALQFFIGRALCRVGLLVTETKSSFAFGTKQSFVPGRAATGNELIQITTVA